MCHISKGDPLKKFSKGIIIPKFYQTIILTLTISKTQKSGARCIFCPEYFKGDGLKCVDTRIYCHDEKRVLIKIPKIILNLSTVFFNPFLCHAFLASHALTHSLAPFVATAQLAFSETDTIAQKTKSSMKIITTTTITTTNISRLI